MTEGPGGLLVEVVACDGPFASEEGDYFMVGAIAKNGGGYYDGLPYPTRLDLGQEMWLRLIW